VKAAAGRAAAAGVEAGLDADRVFAPK